MNHCLPRAHTFQFDAELELYIDGTRLAGRFDKISTAGALLFCSDDVLGDARVDDELRLVFSLPQLEAPVELQAIVRWTKDEAIGVQFVNPRPIEVWGISRLGKTRRQRLKKESRRVANRPAIRKVV